MSLRPVLTWPLPAVDPLIFSLVPIPFVLAALVACYLPAHRASRVDPSVAFRRA